MLTQRKTMLKLHNLNLFEFEKEYNYYDENNASVRIQKKIDEFFVSHSRLCCSENIPPFPPVRGVYFSKKMINIFYKIIPPIPPTK